MTHGKNGSRTRRWELLLVFHDPPFSEGEKVVLSKELVRDGGEDVIAEAARRAFRKVRRRAEERTLRV